MPYVGQKFGRYRIEEEIGAAGMGVVYRAYDEKLERDLAIKVLTPGALNDEAARKRFRNEARILSRLNHPSIQTIHDFETFEGHDFLISELVPGMSLDVRLRSGALPENEVTRLGCQLAQGLAGQRMRHVSVRQFPFGSLTTAVLPIKSGTAPPAFTQGFGSEADFARIPGSRLINQADVPTGMSSNYFVSTRRSVKANLFRIYLLQ
jgi:hypothetical protein